jgi:hypothetical protein
MYFSGEGVPLDKTEAKKWHRRAAEQGEASDQYSLGEIYHSEKKYPEAAMWWRRAAEQGDDAAQYHLGLLYYKGQGVPQDWVLAHMWLNLSASQSNESATKNRDLTASKMTPAQIAEAQKLAREWKPKREAADHRTTLRQPGRGGAPTLGTTPLFEREDDVRIRGRGIYYFREFHETFEVIPPLQFPALQHHPDWLPDTAGVIDLIDSVDLHHPTLLELE